MKKLLQITLALLFFASCSIEEEYRTIKISEFPEVISVKGEVFEYDNPPHLFGHELYMIDSIIVLRNRLEESEFFYLVDKNNGEIIGSFGKRGKGPNEFLYPVFYDQFERKNDSTYMWIHDLHQRKMVLVNLNNYLLKEDPGIEKTMTQPEPVSWGLDILVLPDENLVGRSMSPEGRFFYHDVTTDSTKWVEFFPQVVDPPDKRMMVNLYQGPTRIKPDNSKFVSALNYFKRIDVFSAEEGPTHLFSCVFDDSPENPEFPSEMDQSIPGTLMNYYFDLHLTENYIYAINVNITNEELNKEKDTGYSELHVFSWDGEAVACYKLNHLIFSFSIDEENGYLYGHALPESYEDEEFSGLPLIRFEL